MHVHSHILSVNCYFKFPHVDYNSFFYIPINCPEFCINVATFYGNLPTEVFKELQFLRSKLYLKCTDPLIFCSIIMIFYRNNIMFIIVTIDKTYICLFKVFLFITYSLSKLDFLICLRLYNQMVNNLFSL